MSAAVAGTRPLACHLELDQAEALGESTECERAADVEPGDVAGATKVLPSVYGIASPMFTLCS